MRSGPLAIQYKKAAESKKNSKISKKKLFIKCITLVLKKTAKTMNVKLASEENLLRRSKAKSPKHKPAFQAKKYFQKDSNKNSYKVPLKTQAHKNCFHSSKNAICSPSSRYNINENLLIDKKLEKKNKKPNS